MDMAVIRVNKTSNYTVMSNYHFKEKEMTLKAKGLLSLMLSLPESWDYSIAGLVAICKENESAITSTLKELKKFGYLSVDKLLPNQTESGRIEYIYNIYEQPQKNLTKEKQGVENQGVVFQGVENQGQLNTNKSITKKSITDKSNTDIKERKKAPNGYDAIIAETSFNDEVKETIIEFVKMRKLIKKPMTDYALKKLLNKLARLSSDPGTQITILEKSINNCWQDIYELKDEDKREVKQEAKQEQPSGDIDIMPLRRVAK